MSGSLQDEISKNLAEITRRIYIPTEKIDHQNDNTANNRLFMWNFEEDDLKELVHMFDVYRGKKISPSARMELNSRLQGKMRTMTNEGYVPIECMLYASKMINRALNNDRELTMILADRVRDVYIHKTFESVKVLRNILQRWTWVPQLKVVIVAVGLIGDNEELLDLIGSFADDESLRKNVFHAYMQNKTEKNLERAMRLVINLQDDSAIDEDIGNIFYKEYNNFGSLGAKALEDHINNPGISRLGLRTLRRIQREQREIVTDASGDDYSDEKLNMLANASRDDEAAYKQFVEMCLARNDDQAAFVSRFSRANIVDVFLESFIKNDATKARGRNIALISLGHIGGRGYRPARELIREFADDSGCKYGYMVAMMLLQDRAVIQEFVEILGQKSDFELHELYGFLRNASITRNVESMRLIQQAVNGHLRDLVREARMSELENYVSTLQAFWDFKLFAMISPETSDAINRIIEDCAEERLELNENILISLIDIGFHRYSRSFEDALFRFYRQTPNAKLKNFIYRKLKERQIQPPQ